MFATCLVVFAMTSLGGVEEARTQDQESGLEAVFYAAGFGGDERPCGAGDELQTFSERHSELDVSWRGAPRVGFCASDYLIRWSGYISAPQAGRYYIAFSFRGSNGSLRVGNEIFAGRQYGRVSGGWIDLEPGEPKQLIAELKSNSTSTSARLTWRREGDEEAMVVPTEALSPELPAEEGVSTIMLAERDSIAVEGAYDGNPDASQNTPDKFIFAVHRTPPFIDPVVVHLDYGGDAQYGQDYSIRFVRNVAFGRFNLDEPAQVTIPVGASMVYVEGAMRIGDLEHQGNRQLVVEVLGDDAYEVGARGETTVHLIDDDYPPGTPAQIPDAPIPDLPELVVPDDGDQPDECVSDLDFFVTSVWRDVIEPSCSGCHQGAGVAGRSSMVYDVGGDTADIRRANLAVFRDLAAYRWRDMSLLIAKPLGLAGHGGGRIFSEDDPAMETLQAMVTRSLTEPEDCADASSPEQHIFESVTLLGPRTTFRRAVSRLAGRMPTVSERALIDDDGWAGFDQALAQLLAGEDFNRHFAMLWNQQLRSGQNPESGVNQRFDADAFPYNRWSNEPASVDVSQQIFDRPALMEEPVAIIRHVLRERRPFGEILTADYTVMNGYLARRYGVFEGMAGRFQNSLDPLEDVVGRIPGFPHAGVLTTPSFMILNAGFSGDRNRTRAAAVLGLFGHRSDLTASAASMDIRSLAHNPTENDVQCSGCHRIMDSTAGLFRNWTAGGGYVEDSPWFEEMPQPGLGDNVLPRDLRRESVSWMARQLVDSEDFGRTIAHDVYRVLLEKAPLREPLGNEPYADSYGAVYAAQQAFLARASETFRSNQQDIRILIKAVLKSPWYRAKGLVESAPTPVGARRFELSQMGRSGLLDPVTLNAKLTQRTGTRWQESNGGVWMLSDRSVPFFYLGGWTTEMGGERNSEPNGLARNTHRAMATHVICERVPYEFWLMANRPEQTRRLLPFIDDDTSLFNDAGEVNPDIEQAVRGNLRYLMAWLWEENVAEDHADLDELFEHFVETARAGLQRIEAGDESAGLYTYCLGDYDHDGRQDIPFLDSLRSDANYMIRAWKSLIYVFLTDHLFVLEGGE